MARCLAGEASPEDILQLKTLCEQDPAWCTEFELMRGLWMDADGTTDKKSIDEDLDRVNRKLTERGLR